MNLTNRLILALDVDTVSQAKYFIERLYPKIKIFKIGPVLFSSGGPRIIGLIRKKGAEVFLDLKLFDIPTTVSGAVRQAVRLQVKMLTLHISGGEDMLRSAVQAAREESRRLKIKRPLLIGVTVLTSQKTSPGRVLKLAKAGLACGIDGIVCSAREVRQLKKAIKKRFIAVTPGIRPGKGRSDDQRRTATAYEALREGSDFLVIGRPILNSEDPLRALKQLA